MSGAEPRIAAFEPRHGREVARVLSDAFLDDPVWTAIGPRNRSHRRFANRASFGGILIASYRAGARMRVAVDGGRVAGATIAFDPGKWPIPDVAALWELGWFFLAGPMPVFRGIRDDRALRGDHVHHPHNYLWFIGVEPQLQGRGIGRALMADVHEHAAPSELPVYLETGTLDNVAFYHSLGYRPLGELDLPSGAHIWKMERPTGGS